jgi:predicted CopG family antitoxin
MAKRVMLSDEAYKVLKAMKKEGESFSDVILRRLGKGNPAAIMSYSLCVSRSKSW